MEEEGSIMAPDSGKQFDLGKELLDRLVYQPIGIAAALLKALPNATEEGRKFISGPVQTAQFVGQLAAGVVKARYGSELAGVEDVLSGVRRNVEEKTSDIKRTVGSTIQTIDATVQSIFPRPGAPTEAEPESAAPPEPPKPGGKALVGGVESYDSLTAAQIIDLLDERSLADLSEIELFELAHRRRRTVLAAISRIREERSTQ